MPGSRDIYWAEREDEAHEQHRGDQFWHRRPHALGHDPKAAARDFSGIGNFAGVPRIPGLPGF
jgi:hypothetical protein